MTFSAKAVFERVQKRQAKKDREKAAAKRKAKEAAKRKAAKAERKARRKAKKERVRLLKEQARQRYKHVDLPVEKGVILNECRREGCHAGPPFIAYGLCARCFTALRTINRLDERAKIPRDLQAAEGDIVLISQAHPEPAYRCKYGVVEAVRDEGAVLLVRIVYACPASMVGSTLTAMRAMIEGDSNAKVIQVLVDHALPVGTPGKDD